MHVSNHFGGDAVVRYALGDEISALSAAVRVNDTPARIEPVGAVVGPLVGIANKKLPI